MAAELYFIVIINSGKADTEDLNNGIMNASGHD